MEKKENKSHGQYIQRLSQIMDLNVLGLCLHFGKWCQWNEFSGQNGATILQSIVPITGHCSPTLLKLSH